MTEEKHSGSEPADLSRFTLSSRAEIVQHLRAIIALRQNVTVFSNKGKSFIITRLLDIDPQRGVMVLDWGAKEHENRMLLQSERNVFVSAPSGVKTQFATGEVREISFEGAPAFEAPLPEQVIRLQRRDFFRIHTPVAQPVICRLSDHPEGEKLIPLFDISLGGMALTLTPAQAGWLSEGMVLRQAVIELKPFGTLQVGVEVRHIIKMQLKNGLEMLRAGCLFQGMNTPRETLVQRYIAQLERERRALVR
ncbi:MAG: flagellar brake protein [Vogesella sp.]|uniref:flagellar brake protein n=1 Tax=Vogesella sp. TaxID=1904252 RepID=UPI0011CA14E8